MAKFKLELPTEILNDIQMINDNAEQIFGEMTKAGAETVKINIETNAPTGVKKSPMMNCLKTTRYYKTPSNDGVSTKVAFYGYFKNEHGQMIPADLVAKVFEYGRSSSDYPTKPFIRRSFKKGQIEKAMLDKQKEMTGGLLE